MVFSEYAKGWMLVLQREGHRPRRIVSILTDEGVPASVAGVLQRDKQRGERTVVERRKCGGGDANERWPNDAVCGQTRLAVWQLCDLRKCAEERLNQCRIVWGHGTAVAAAVVHTMSSRAFTPVLCRRFCLSIRLLFCSIPCLFRVNGIDENVYSSMTHTVPVDLGWTVSVNTSSFSFAFESD